MEDDDSSPQSINNELFSNKPIVHSPNGELGSEDDHFEEDDDDEDWSLDRKKKSKKASKKVAVKRKGPLSRVKNTDGVGAKGRRGASPSVTDSPASLGAVESSIHDDEEDDSSDQSINNELFSNKPIVHSETLKIACSQLLETWIDEEYSNIGREVGKVLRRGELEVLDILNNVPDEYKIVDAPGLDIFGNPLMKEYNFECECPKCHRKLACSSFAPHLEKCMGMGRNSSRIASRRLPAASNNANNNSNNPNNSSSDSSKNSAQGNSSSGQAPLTGEPGSEYDHFEEDDDDDDENWSLGRKKKSKKASKKVAVKRNGPLSRVKNTDGVGAKGRRGASPSVTDSPASLGAVAVESSIHDDEDDISDQSINNELFSNKPIVHSPNGELGSEDDHFEEDDDDEDWTLDRKKNSKKASKKVAVKRKGPLSRVKNTDGVGAKGRRGASPSVTDSPASLGAVESSIHDDEDDISDQSINNELFSNKPIVHSPNGELGSEDDHFEEDDDDEDWTLDRKKNSKKASKKVAVKRKGPLSRVKNTDGVGAKGRRGASPSVTDSPASLGAVESSIHDDEEDDSSDQSINNELFSNKPIVHSETLKIASRRLPAASNNANNNSNNPNNSSIDSNKNSSQGNSSSSQAPLNGELGSEDDHFEKDDDDEDWSLDRKKKSKKASKKVAVKRNGPLSRVKNTDGVGAKGRRDASPSVTDSPASLAAVESSIHDEDDDSSHQSINNELFSNKPIVHSPQETLKIASRRLPAASNNANNNSNNPNNSSIDSNKNSSQGNSSSSQAPLNGELGSEDDHFEKDDDDEDSSLDPKKKSKKTSKKVAVKRKGPLSRVKNTDGVGAKGRCGASPSITDSPASLGAVESSIHDDEEDDSSDQSINNELFSNKPIVHSETLKIASRRLPAASNNANNNSNNPNNSSIDSNKNSSQGNSSSSQAPLNGELGSEDDHFEKDDDDEDWSLDRKKKSKKASKKVAVKRNGPLSRVKNTDGVGAKGRRDASPSVTDSPASLAAVESSIHDEDDDSSHQSINNELFSNKPIVHSPQETLKIASRRLPAASNNANNNSNNPNNSSIDSNKNSSQGNSSSSQAPLNGELGSEDDHFEKDDDDEDWSLDRKKKSKKASKKVAVKRNGPLSRVKNTDGVGAKGRRDASPSVTDSPASLAAVESSIHDEDDDSSHQSINNELFSNKPIVHSPQETLKIASRRLPAASNNANNNSNNPNNSSIDSNKNSSQGNSSSGQAPLNGELGSEDDHFEKDDDDEDSSLDPKKKSKKTSKKVAVKRKGPLSRVKNTDGVGAKGRCGASPSITDSPASLGAVESSIHDDEEDDSSDQSINNELFSNKPIVHSETLKIACFQFLEMCIDEEYSNIGREIGKLLRWGELEALGILNNVPDEYKIVDAPGVDIFGNPLTKKYNFQCECPICHRKLACSRYAPHLEKCMGMGRNSSRIASRRLPAASNNANNNSNNPNNSSSDSNKNSSQGNSSSGQAPLTGEPGSEYDHFEKDDDDEDWSLDRKKKSKKASKKVAVKRKGPLSKVKNTDGVGAKGRRGASTSVTDSPASLCAVESSIHDDKEDDISHQSINNELFSNKPIVHSETLKIASRRLPAASNNANNNSNNPNNSSSDSNKNSSQGNSSSGQAPLNGELGSEDDHFEKDDDDEDSSLDPKKKSKKTSKKVAVKRNGPLSRVKNTDGVGAKGRRDASPSVTDSPASLAAVESSIHDEDDDSSHQSINNELFSNKPIVHSETLKIASRRLPAASNNANNNSNNPNNSSIDSNKNSSQGNSSSSQAPLNGDLGSEDDHFEEDDDDDDEDWSLDRKKKSKKASKKVAVKRKGPLSRVKNTDGVGAKGRRDASPSVTDSPASLGAVESSIHDEDNSTHMSLP